MAVGKRHSTDEPLTEHDVATRLNAAALRTIQILTSARELGMAGDVCTSRYLAAGMLEGLADELARWGVRSGPKAGGEGRDS